jgi:O-antigen/teichoic acid export membrane protein
VLVMTGRERELAFCVGIGAALNLGLSAALIPLIGLDGAAIGTATGLACANLLMAWLAWRRVGVWSAVAGRSDLGRP